MKKGCRLKMVKVKEICRLSLQLGMSQREISASVGVSKSVVQKALSKIKDLNLQFADIEQMTDEEISSLFYKLSKEKKRNRHSELPCEELWLEMKKHKHLTLKLLFEEHKEKHCWPGSYWTFCLKMKEHKKLNSSKAYMRQEHSFGDGASVDYAGQTIPIIIDKKGEVRKAQIFVMTLNASNYIYFEATWTQSSLDFLSSHIRAFHYFEGVPKKLIPDNLKAAVIKADRYVPQLNEGYIALASHYGCHIQPARVRKPKDKAKVEVSVKIIERWALAKIRNRTFSSLSELNEVLADLREEVNNHFSKVLDNSRTEFFKEFEKPLLNPLPIHDFEPFESKIAKVQNNCHVEFMSNFYSVDSTHVGKNVFVKATARIVEIFLNSERLATHQRAIGKNKWCTADVHMPKDHRAYRDSNAWSPERYINWAKNIGKNCALFTEKMLHSREYPQYAYRSLMGVLKLEKEYGRDRVENACAWAIHYNLISSKKLIECLENNLDCIFINNQKSSTSLSQKHHENIRGQEYYATIK